MKKKPKKKIKEKSRDSRKKKTSKLRKKNRRNKIKKKKKKFIKRRKTKPKKRIRIDRKIKRRKTVKIRKIKIPKFKKQRKRLIKLSFQKVINFDHFLGRFRAQKWSWKSRKYLMVQLGNGIFQKLLHKTSIVPIFGSIGVGERNQSQTSFKKLLSRRLPQSF